MPLSYGDVGQGTLHSFFVQIKFNMGSQSPRTTTSAPAQAYSTSGTWSNPSTRSSFPSPTFQLTLPRSFRGETATEFLEWLTPSSLSPLPAYSSTLSLLLSPTGGILDDLIITKHSPTAYYLVTNAGRRAHDLAHFQSHLAQWNAGALAKKRGGVDMEVLEGWGLVALQGPRAAGVLQGLTGFDLGGLTFGRSAWVGVEGGFNVHVARGGYTGEDGFEVRLRFLFPLIRFFLLLLRLFLLPFLVHPAKHTT